MGMYRIAEHRPVETEVAEHVHIMAVDPGFELRTVEVEPPIEGGFAEISVPEPG